MNEFIHYNSKERGVRKTDLAKAGGVMDDLNTLIYMLGCAASIFLLHSLQRVSTVGLLKKLAAYLGSTFNRLPGKDSTAAATIEFAPNNLAVTTVPVLTWQAQIAAARARAERKLEAQAQLLQTGDKASRDDAQSYCCSRSDHSAA